MGVCRNCGGLAWLDSSMGFNRYGVFCAACCHNRPRVEPPFKLSEEEYRARKSLYELVGSVREDPNQ